MWPSAGGYCYWGSREEESEGIVVVLAWMLSKPRHVQPYVRLYQSLGRHWDSLICHSRLLNLFFPSQATSLALSVLDELSKEVAKRPRPIVFAAFSGGAKSCMYKIFQIIKDKSENLDCDSERYELVRKCVAGQIYDSSPVDFTSELGTNFAVHPTVLNLRHPPRLLRWGAQATSWALDSLFLGRFEAQRAEYWQTLYSSVNMGPILLLCSEDDDLAPFQTIHNFASRMRELGGEVKLVAWKSCPHVGHYRHHPEEYRDAVLMHLTKAASYYLVRMGKLFQQETISRDSNCKMSKTVSDVDEGAMNSFVSKQNNLSTLTSFPKVQTHKLLVSYTDVQKEELADMQSYSSPGTQDSLGKLSFDLDMPKDIDDWEMKPFNSSLEMFDRSASPNARSGLINSTRFVRRCRL